MADLRTMKPTLKTLVLLVVVLHGQSSDAQNSFVLTGTRNGAQVAYNRVELKVDSLSDDFLIDKGLESVQELTLSAASDRLLADSLSKLVNRLPRVETVQLSWNVHGNKDLQRLKQSISQFAEACPKLSTLRLRGPYTVIAPPPVDPTALRNVRVLELHGFEVQDQLSSLVKQTRLESLELLSYSDKKPRQLSANDIRSLQELKTLESLTIVGYVQKASDLDLKQSFPQLRSLSLGDCTVDELAPHVHTLRFGACEIHLAALQSLGDVKSLRTLVFHRSGLSEDVRDQLVVRIPGSLQELAISSATPVDPLPAILMRSTPPHVTTRMLVKTCQAEDLELIRHVTSFEVLCGCDANAFKQFQSFKKLRELWLTIDTDSHESLAPLLAIPELTLLELRYRGDASGEKKVVDLSQLPVSKTLQEVVFQGFPDASPLNWIIQQSPSLSKISVVMAAIREGDMKPVQRLGQKVSLKLELCTLSRNCLREILQGRNIRELRLLYNEWVDDSPSLGTLLKDSDAIETLQLIAEDFAIGSLGELQKPGRMTSIELCHAKLTPADIGSLSVSRFVLGNEDWTFYEHLHYFGRLVHPPK